MTAAPAAPPAPSAARTLGPLVVLYVGSGLPYGVVNELAPAWLITEGASLETVGLATLLGLPWTLKPLWAPAVDRFGRAGAWVSGALALVGLCCLALPGLPMGPAAAAVLLLMATASATQDIAVDGHAAAVTPPALQGRLNGARVAAWRGAVLLVGGGGVALAPTLGFPMIYGLCAAACFALAAFAFVLPARPRPESESLNYWGALLHWVQRPGGVVMVAFVLLYKLGDAALSPMVKPFWIHNGMTLTELGLFSTSLGAGLTVLGALVGGEICTRAGLWPSLLGLGLIQAVTNLGYAAAAAFPSREAVMAASVGESLGQGLGTAATLTLLMRLCEGEQTATRFALLTALAGLTRVLAGAVSGYGAASLGYTPYFVLTFVLALPALTLLPALRRRLHEPSR